MSKIIIFTAPSGAGKTTLVKHVLAHQPKLAFSVSATTRPPRPNEIHGADYYFISPSEFDALVQQDAFIEWEEVYPGRRYGSLYSEVERLNRAGKCVLFDIDVKGASRLKEKFGKEALVVFVNPPSKEVLIQRLLKRNTEKNEDVSDRIEKMEQELEYIQYSDAVIQNHDLDTAQKEALQVVNEFLDRWENK